MVWAGFDSLSPDSPIDTKLPILYNLYTGGTGPIQRGALTKHQHQTPMSIKTSELVSLGSLAAEAFSDFDTAQQQLNDSFGVPYTAAKDNLLRDVAIAEGEGLDLRLFSGEESRFRFPSFNTNIVVRIHRKPTQHNKLEKLAAKVAKLEGDLKLAKMCLKHEAEQLVAAGVCDEITDKIVLAFTRIK